MHFRLCDYVLDLVQNAVESGASLVRLRLDEQAAQFRLTLEDNGCGMDEATSRRALDPFYSDGIKHAARKVGLGLPFVKQALEATGGNRSQAARLLGLSRPTLIAKIEKYGLRIESRIS